MNIVSEVLALRDERDTLKAELEKVKAACLKHEGHEHCVTPCDSIRIQESNHNAYLEMKDQRDVLSAQLVAQREELKDAQQSIACIRAAIQEWPFGKWDHERANIIMKEASRQRDRLQVALSFTHPIVGVVEAAKKWKDEPSMEKLRALSAALAHLGKLQKETAP